MVIKTKLNCEILGHLFKFVYILFYFRFNLSVFMIILCISGVFIRKFHHVEMNLEGDIIITISMILNGILYWIIILGKLIL